MDVEVYFQQIYLSINQEKERKNASSVLEDRLAGWLADRLTGLVVERKFFIHLKSVMGFDNCSSFFNLIRHSELILTD